MRFGLTLEGNVQYMYMYAPDSYHKKKNFQQKLESSDHFSTFSLPGEICSLLRYFAVNTMYFLWHSLFYSVFVGSLQVMVLSKNSRLSSQEGQPGHGHVITVRCQVKGGVSCKCLRMMTKMSLFIKIWHTFPHIIKARSAHANHSLKAIETSFVLIRLVSDPNQRRWVLTFIFPPASQFQNINVLDVLIEPDNEFSSSAGWHVILFFFSSFQSSLVPRHHLDQNGLIWPSDCFRAFQGQRVHFLHISMRRAPEDIGPRKCSVKKLNRRVSMVRFNETVQKWFIWIIAQ